MSGATVDPALSRRPLYALVTANAVSLTGSTLTVVALPWFVLQTSGSATHAGLVGFSAAAPRVLAGIFGGALVDRLGPRRTSVLADLLSGAAIAAIPLLFQLGALPFVRLLTLVLIGNALTIPGGSARRALVPELAEQARTSLERVNSAVESIQYLARLLGAPLAGVLIVLLGAGNVLWLDAASFALSAALVGALIPAHLHPVGRVRAGYWPELADGWRALRSDRLLLTMALALLLFNPLSLPLGSVILPVYAERFLGSAAGLGLLVAAIGLGGVAGALAYGASAGHISRRNAWLLPFLLGPVEYWGLLAHPPLAAALPLFALVGLVFGPLNPVMATVRQERVPLALRGRVFSLFAAITIAGQPLGVALAGIAIDRLGFDATVLLFAAVLQLLGLALLFIPVLAEMDRAPGGR